MPRDRFNRPKRKSKLKRVLFFLIPMMLLFGGSLYLQATGKQAVLMQKLQSVISGIVDRQMDRQEAAEKQARLSSGAHPELR